MQPGSFLVSKEVMCSPGSIVPCADRIEANWWSLEKQFLHTKLARDLEIPHRSWQTDGNKKSQLGKSDLAGQKRTSSQSSRPHRRRRRRQPMMQQIPEQYQKYMNTRTRMKKRTTTMGEDEESPDKPDDEDHAMEEETLLEPRHICDVEPRREAHRNTRECVRGKTADDEATKAPDHTCPTS